MIGPRRTKFEGRFPNQWLRGFEVSLRLGIGITMLFAGLAKARLPHEFLAVVYDYQIVGPPYGRFVAMVLPQLEIIIGSFLLVRFALELFPKPVDGRDRLSGDVSFSVDEHDAVDQLLQSLAPVQFPPA